MLSENRGRGNTSELITFIPKPDKDFTRQNKTTDQYPS